MARDCEEYSRVGTGLARQILVSCQTLRYLSRQQQKCPNQ